MLYYILFWTLLGFIIHFYIIFGTNLLTGGPAQNCCFLPVLGFRRKEYQTESKRNETFRNVIFGMNVTQRTWTLRQDINQEATRSGARLPPRRALHPRGPPIAPPTYSFLLYTYVPPNDQIRSQNPNSTTVTSCIHEIPSWGLFRSSVGGGIDHGGLLHHNPSPSDEV